MKTNEEMIKVLIDFAGLTSNVLNECLSILEINLPSAHHHVDKLREQWDSVEKPLKEIIFEWSEDYKGK